MGQMCTRGVTKCTSTDTSKYPGTSRPCAPRSQQGGQHGHQGGRQGLSFATCSYMHVTLTSCMHAYTTFANMHTAIALHCEPVHCSALPSELTQGRGRPPAARAPTRVWHSLLVIIVIVIISIAIITIVIIFIIFLIIIIVDYAVVTAA